MQIPLQRWVRIVFNILNFEEIDRILNAFSEFQFFLSKVEKYGNVIGIFSKITALIDYLTDFWICSKFEEGSDFRRNDDKIVIFDKFATKAESPRFFSKNHTISLRFKKTDKISKQSEHVGQPLRTFAHLCARGLLIANLR